jgi:hypothetical protein
LIACCRALNSSTLEHNDRTAIIASARSGDMGSAIRAMQAYNRANPGNRITPAELQRARTAKPTILGYAENARNKPRSSRTKYCAFSGGRPSLLTVIHHTVGANIVASRIHAVDADHAHLPSGLSISATACVTALRMTAENVASCSRSASRLATTSCTMPGHPASLEVSVSLTVVFTAVSKSLPRSLRSAITADVFAPCRSPVVSNRMLRCTNVERACTH